MAKNTLIKGMFFCLILIALILIINQLYVVFILQEKIEYSKEKDYQNFISNSPNKTIDYAFFGDSHLFDDVNTNYIPNSYNFGFGGENYIETRYRLKNLLYNDNVKINHAVFSIDMQTFSDVMVAGDHAIISPYPFSKFLSVSEVYSIDKSRSVSQIFIERYLPFLGKGNEIKFLFLKEKTELHNGGISRQGDFTKSDINFSIEDRYKHYFLEKERINDLSMKYFLRTLELAKGNNIKIIFVKYPITKEFRDYINEKNITQEDYYNEILKNVELTIGKDYEVLDYYSFFENSSYFHDPDHLNQEGSEIFSKKLNLDLQSLGINYLD